MEGTQFPDPKYSLLTTSEKPSLTSENRENLEHGARVKSGVD